jgi:hypothetical protein
MKPLICVTGGLPRKGKDVTSREGSVIVAVKLMDETDFVHQGRMGFVDNVIDKASGNHPGSGSLGQSGRRFDTRHVRAHPCARDIALSGHVGAGGSDRN